jgi:hypothetical protein
MTNFDPRLELARQIASSKRTGTPLPNTGIAPTGVSTYPAGGDPKTAQLRNKVTSTGMTISQRYPNLTSEVSKITSKQHKPTGLLAGIFSSAPVKVIMKPLEVLSYGRTAVISGLRELTDALDADPNTKASVGDWFKQAKNPAYGFGTAFPMKGNWGRFVGLVGDIGLDPITYMTLGAGEAASFSERLALAPKLLDKGIAEETVSKFLARGKSVLTAEEIASAGMKKTGLYMFGSKLRVPLSGPVGESMLAMGSWGKNAFTHTNIGEALQRGFMGMGKQQSIVIRDLRLALARGEQIPESVLKQVGSIGGLNAREAAIRFLGASNVRDAAKGIAQQEFSILAATRLGEMGKETLQQYGKTVHQVIEGTRTAANDVEQRLADQLKNLYKEIWDNVDTKFKALDPASSIGHVPEYFPWVITDEAKAELQDLTKPWVKSLNTIIEGNPLDAKGSFKSRTLKEGHEFFWTTDANGVKTPYILKEADLNVQRINEISKSAIGVDFFKTDAVDVLANHYVNSASTHVGTLALYEDLYKSGVVRKILETSGPSAEMHAYHAGTVDALVGHTGNAMEDANIATKTYIELVTKEMNKTLPNLEKTATAAEKNFVVAGEAVRTMGDDLAAVKTAHEAVVAARKNLETVQALWDNIYEADIPELATASQASLEAQINTLKELEAYSTDKITELKQTNNQLAGLRMRKGKLTKEERQLEHSLRIQSLTDEAKRIELDRRYKDLATQFEESQAMFERHMELSNVLNVRAEDIVDGKRFKSTILNRVKKIIGGESKLPKVEGMNLAKSFEDFANDPGALKAWLNANLGNQDFFQTVEKYFKTAKNTKSIFNKTDIAKMTTSELHTIVAAGSTGVGGAFDSIRAAVHILARDAKFYGSKTPDALMGMRQTLIRHLEEQANFVGFLELAKTENTSARSLLVSAKQADAFRGFAGTMEADYGMYLDVKNWRDEVLAQVTDPNNSMNLGDDLGNDFFNPDSPLSVLHAMISPDNETIAAGLDAAEVAINALEKKKYVFNQHNIMQTYDINQINLVKDFEASLNTKIDSYLTASTTELKFTGARFRQLVRTGNSSTNELSDALAAYSMASEVERRFSALGTELSAHGFIPTEEMHSSIVRKVVREHYDKVISRQSEVSIVREKMDEIRAAVETAIGQQNGGRTAFGVVDEASDPVKIFDNMIEQLYQDPVVGEAMNNVMGPIQQYHSQGVEASKRFLSLQKGKSEEFNTSARDWFYKNAEILGQEIPKGEEPSTFLSNTIKPLLKALYSDDQEIVGNIITPENINQITKIIDEAKVIYAKDVANGVGLKDFENNHLKKWFEAAVPYQKYNRQNAMNALKTMSPTKNERNMKEFFVDLLGGQRRNPASTDADLVVTKVRGKLNIEWDTLSNRTRKMINGMDESVSAEAFLADPFGLPTGAFTYASSLENLANNLGEQIKKLKASGEIKGITSAEKEALAAEAKAGQAGVKLGETTPTASKAARSTPYKVTPEREQQLADSIRKIRAKHDRLISSPAYVMAKKDQEITSMLEKLTSVDGHLMHDIHTGEAGWNLDPKNPVVKLKDLGFGEVETNNLIHVVDATTETFGPDSYMISPDGTKIYSIAEGGYDSLVKQYEQLASSARAAFKLNPNDPFVDAANTEYNAFKTGKGWRHVTVKRVSSTEDVNVNNIFKINVTDSNLAEGGANIIGERDIMRLTDRADIRALTTPKFATYRTPASTAERKRIADSLFSQQAITPDMHAALTSERHIGDVLEQKFANADNTVTTLKEQIKNWEFDTYARNKVDKGSIDQFSSDILNNLFGNEQKLTFTESEWESLFNTPFTPAEGAKNANAIGVAKKKLEVWKGHAKSGRKFIQEPGVEGRTTVITKIKEIESEIERLNLERTARTGGSQSSALEKARQLFEQFDTTSGRGSTNKAVERFIGSRSDNLSPEFVRSTRKGGLSKSWASTSSYKTILEEKAISGSEEMQAYMLQSRGVRELERSASQARKIAAEKRLGISVREGEIVDTAQQILDDAIGSGNPQIIDTFKQAFNIETGDNGAPLITSVKLDTVTQKIPDETRNLVKNLREQNASTISPFNADSAREQALIDAVTVNRANLAQHNMAVFRDLYNPDRVVLNDKLAVIRSKIGELDAKELELVKQQKVLVDRIAVAEGLNKSTYENAYRQYVTGYSLTKKGNISNVVKAKPDVPGKISAAREIYLNASADLFDVQAKYDSIMPAFVDASGAAEDAELILRPRIKQIEDLLAEKKNLGTLRMQDSTKTFKGKTTEYTANYEEYQKWIKESKDALDLVNLDPSNPLHAVYAEVARTQNVYMRDMLLQKGTGIYRDIMKSISMPTVFDNIDAVVNSGYASLEKFGLKGMEAPQEILDMFENIRRFKEPAFSRGFGSFINGYTGFFKRYATLSPGFHVRNALSNTFSLVAAGGDLRNFPAGLRLYSSFREAMHSGSTLEKWLESIANPVERARAELAARGMFAAGGGMTSDAFSQFLEKGSVLKRLEDNLATRTSRQVGANIENSARFMLGYDSAVKGLDFQQTAARIKRFLIDYEDLGQYDKVMKTIVPFWMWTSRALPMHLTNMWVNPRPYALYESFKRNYSVNDPNGLTPSWITDQGGFKITGGTYLMPDLGFNRIGQLSAQASDPSKLLSMVNPALRVPLELAAGKKFYSGQQFSGKPTDVSGNGINSALASLLGAIGMAGTDSKGNKVANEKALYALNSLIPSIGQAERLVPSKPNKPSNWLSYLGVPVQQDSPNLQRSALYDQLKQLNDLKTSQGM